MAAEGSQRPPREDTAVEGAAPGKRLNEAARRALEEAAERREAVLKENTRRAGVDLFAVSTEEDLVDAIVRMAALRKKRRR